MKTIALNIETCPCEELVNTLPEPEVKLGNVKKPELIKERMDEAIARARERMALDPFYGRLLCITMATRKPDGIKVATQRVLNTAEEPAALPKVWKLLRGTESEPVRVVTFNGAEFDIPFLQARSIAHGVEFPTIERSPYRTTSFNGDSRHFDVMQFLHQLCPSNPMGLPRTLPVFAKLLLRRDFPFANPYAKFDQSNLAEVIDVAAQLCEWNCRATLDLFEAIEKKHL